MDGLVHRMTNMSAKNLTVIVVGRRTEVTTHVGLLTAGPSGKGRKVALIPLTVDPSGHHEEWDSLFPYDKSTPDALRCDRQSSHRSLWLMVAVIYPQSLHSENRKFPVALQYTVSPSMEGPVYITTVVEHLLHRVLQFPAGKENAMVYIWFWSLVVCRRLLTIFHISTGAFNLIKTVH